MKAAAFKIGKYVDTEVGYSKRSERFGKPFLKLINISYNNKLKC